MKKLLVMALAVSMAAAVTGCTGGTSTETTAATTAAETTAEAEETTESAAETESDQETTEAADVMSYQEYMDAELDTEVTVQAYVQAKQSWWENQATVYAQDEEGAYFLYNMACSEEDYEKLVPGTKIQVTGYKAEGEEYIAPALDVTELLGTDQLIDHQNQFVEFKGLTVESAGQDDSGNDVAFLYNWDGSGTEGDDLYFNASYNGQTYTFTVESYLCDSSTEVYSAVKALEIGQTIDMEGFLYWYEGVNPHITSVTVAE